jgi:hypothetical protein
MFLLLWKKVVKPCQLELTPRFLGHFDRPASINAFAFKFLDFYGFSLDRCYDFQKKIAEKFSEKMAFLTQTKGNFEKK